MEQYIKKSALVAEIWKRRDKYFNFGGSPSSEYCHEDDEILGLINTLEVIYLQEMPVSEDLEKAANQWDVKASFTPFYMTLDGNGKPNGVKQDFTTHAESFKAGANWQKEQIMENAIKCEITWMDGFMLNYTQEQQDDLLEKIGVKVGDKVKLVIIKEE